MRWKLLPLTARDAAAPYLGGALSLATPRTDDTLAGVKVPTAHVAATDDLVPRAGLRRTRRAAAGAVVGRAARGAAAGADAQRFIDAGIAAWQASGQPG